MTKTSKLGKALEGEANGMGKIRITSDFWIDRVREHGGQFRLRMGTIIAG